MKHSHYITQILLQVDTTIKGHILIIRINYVAHSIKTRSIFHICHAGC